MLTDVALKSLKPRNKPFKVADRDGMARPHRVLWVEC